MYDKVKFWIDANVVSRQEIAQLCERLNLSQDSDKYIGNLCLRVHNGSISGCGSFSKFIYGDNLHTIDRLETEAVVNALCDVIGCDISRARVTQLEFGTNFHLSQPVGNYLNLLGSSPRTKRIEEAINDSSPQTITYRPNGKQGYFRHKLYDKGAEAGVKGNILRYELRFTTRIARYLKIKGGITLSTLYDSHFYDYMQQRYYDFYDSIKKMNDVTINSEAINTVGDGFETFVAMLINETNPNRIEEYLAELKRLGVYDDPKYYSRLKAKLNAIAERKAATSTSELIDELNTEIQKLYDSG